MLHKNKACDRSVKPFRARWNKKKCQSKFFPKQGKENCAKTLYMAKDETKFTEATKKIAIQFVTKKKRKAGINKPYVRTVCGKNTDGNWAFTCVKQEKIKGSDGWKLWNVCK